MSRRFGGFGIARGLTLPGLPGRDERLAGRVVGGF